MSFDDVRWILSVCRPSLSPGLFVVDQIHRRLARVLRQARLMAIPCDVTLLSVKPHSPDPKSAPRMLRNGSYLYYRLLC